ncbi:hypothetical protein BB559_005577 [Furculomyces boomerangus]|uniref:Uncharacterized protein n=2 Tax=Harpellales TaxID=61421 RepID=A0A2T9Y7W2_9FUNG|nr:hypothetical protein BB559_005577 [Furculomyces boomerangus]PVZ98156.1 hypothetical protein BB558_005845 [Smittium angustum]
MKMMIKFVLLNSYTFSRNERMYFYLFHSHYFFSFEYTPRFPSPIPKPNRLNDSSSLIQILISMTLQINEITFLHLIQPLKNNPVPVYKNGKFHRHFEVV